MVQPFSKFLLRLVTSSLRQFKIKNSVVLQVFGLNPRIVEIFFHISPSNIWQIEAARSKKSYHWFVFIVSYLDWCHRLGHHWCAGGWCGRCFRHARVSLWLMMACRTSKENQTGDVEVTRFVSQTIGDAPATERLYFISFRWEFRHILWCLLGNVFTQAN